MSNTVQKNEPRGFTNQTRGANGEHAHDLGWQLNEEARTGQPPGEEHVALPGGQGEIYGGQGYDFGSKQDEGDTAARMKKEAQEKDSKAA